MYDNLLSGIMEVSNFDGFYLFIQYVILEKDRWKDIFLLVTECNV